MVAIKFSPDCRFILVGSEDGNIYTINHLKRYKVNLIVSC